MRYCAIADRSRAGLPPAARRHALYLTIAAKANKLIVAVSASFAEIQSPVCVRPSTFVHGCRPEGMGGSCASEG